jgi:heme/copper-type cytochrome/quinol oxidase subunit 2
MTIILRVVAIVGLLSTTAWAVPDRNATSMPVASEARQQSPAVREFTVRAHRYAFSPTRIELNQGDIIRITLITEDIPHSFTIDEYRISKRVPPEHSVTVNSAPTNLASSSTTVA